MNYNEAIKKLHAKEIEKIYLIYGEETYLVEEFIKTIKEKVVGKDFEDLNLFTIEGKEFTLEKLIDACETLPFMAEKKLVLVKDLETFQGKKKSISEEEEKKLAAYIANIPETTSLVFYGSTTIDARKKIVKEIQKQGAVLYCQRLNAKELREWVQKSMKRHGKTIDIKEVEYFIENIDYLGKTAVQSLLDVENEIKKITTFVGDRASVVLSDLENIFSSSFQNDIFKLLDAIEKKHMGEAIKRFNAMIHKGEPVIKIAVTLGNQVRNLLKTKLLLEEGYSSKMIAGKIGIHPYVATKCANQCRGFSTERLEALLNHFLQVDLAIKSGKMKDHIAIELFIIEMCR
ncbi:DNA polymerase III subunit delta [Clostridium formicaceticum]|uniref:DNA polymerase III subunit delta n=1 Tax=Clostridium formicaceticum TaxID=1497 RepID=A0AAC9WHW9_9CLOT|nr:DNA polymerase III subunit delta [Clostridium formicaceticum]AOY77577.1 DNA polymerase III subunit delta [Clostridium formicaceticum]ARE88155.1 DNA polymerase III subunit delta [Clostridium formicaceticum]